MGFCGGCLSHQRDIPLNRLFHRALSAMLEERFGIRLRIVIARDFERRAAERVARLIEAPLDMMLIHVRSIPAVPNARLVAKEIVGGKATLRLNRRWGMARWFPAARRAAYHYDLSGADDMAQGSYHRGSRLNRLNITAGVILGVAEAAIREAVEEALEAVAAARRRAVPAAVLGPPPSEQSGRGGRWICDRLNEAMQSSSRRDGFPYVDLYPGWDDAFLMWDGLHLNVAGHHHVAERLAEGIGGALASLGRPEVPSLQTPALPPGARGTRRPRSPSL
jgi:hypothetical protein